METKTQTKRRGDNLMEHHGNCTCIECCPEFYKCANCEECGAAIYPDFRLCERCEDTLMDDTDGAIMRPRG